MLPLLLCALLSQDPIDPNPLPLPDPVKVVPTLLSPPLPGSSLAGTVTVKVRLDTDLGFSRNRSLTVYLDGVSLGPPTDGPSIRPGWPTAVTP